MYTMYLIRGIPGSGKTTLARKMLAEKKIQFHTEADNYFTDLDGVYRFDPSKLKNAHGACQEAVKYLTLSGYDIAISNTFTREWEMDVYFKIAHERGYDVKIIRCTGEYDNVHAVPADKVRQMKDRFEDVEGEIFHNGE